jgi:hypothetical protein
MKIVFMCLLLFLNCFIQKKKHYLDGNCISELHKIAYERILKVQLEGHDYWVSIYTNRAAICHSESCKCRKEQE